MPDSPYGNHVESVVFMFGKSSDPEIAKSFIEPISKLFTEQYAKPHENIEACIGEEADMVQVDLYGLEYYVHTHDLFAFLAEIPDDFFDYKEPEIKVYSTTMVKRARDLKHL